MLLQWKGYLTEPLMWEACRLQLEFAKQNSVYIILSDIRLFEGTWKKYMPYLLHVYTPKIVSYGLRRCAVLSEDDPFHKFTIRKYQQQLPNKSNKIKLFHNTDSALSWLSEAVPVRRDMTA